MGHTSKFTFPLPSRRNKSTAATATSTISGPLSKAQKILGTGQINVDSPTSASRPSSRQWEAGSHTGGRGWETTSNSGISGISISVSDSTASHGPDRDRERERDRDRERERDTGLGIVNEDEVMEQVSSRGRRWEDESEVIPRTGFDGGQLMPGRGHEAMTDASSLRRRTSSSTITSFYDKAKQPLSISQQTSSSAMAKGLPSKANALLDIGNDTSPKNKKKKPAMLDLSHLLPRVRASKHLQIPTSGKPVVLGPDLMTRSPSVMSISPAESTPPPIGSRLTSRLRKKSTRERLREEAQQVEPRPQTQPVPETQVQTQRDLARRGDEKRHMMTKSTANLYSLYDHYEKRTFQDVLEDDELAAEELDIPPVPKLDQISIPGYPTPPTSSSTRGFLSPNTQPSVRSSTFSAQSGSVITSPETPGTTATMSPPSIVSVPADCSASISSRHTRTSKASKRTDHSMTDIDLKMNSVLSLSSDSDEDDFSDVAPRTSLSVPGSLQPSDGQSSPTSPRSALARRSTSTTESQDMRPRPTKRTSFATNHQYLTIPENRKHEHSKKQDKQVVETKISITQSLAPKITSRFNSLASAAAPRVPMNGPSPPARSSSRMSNTSTTSNSVLRSSYDHRIPSVHEARALPMLPPHAAKARQAQATPEPLKTRLPNDRPTPSPTPRAPSSPHHHARRASDQPTPPLSPTSVDFYLANHSEEPEVASNSATGLNRPSSRASAASGGRHRSGSTNSIGNRTSSGRLMAVTRQEEMLLAALRLKRMRMRETIIAEFEEEQLESLKVVEEHTTLPGWGSGFVTKRPTLDNRESSSTIRQSSSSRSTLRKDSLTSPKPQIRVSAGSTTGPVVGDDSLMSPISRTGSGSDVSERGQILLMLDRPVGSVDELDTAEPSPDLDDFLDFNDGSEEYMTESPLERHREIGGRSSVPVSGTSSGRSSSLSHGRKLSLTERFSSRQHQPETKVTRRGDHPRRDSDPLSSKAMPRQSVPREDAYAHARIPEEPADGDQFGAGLPRPDSPIGGVASMFPKPGKGGKPLRKTQVRLSAVGAYNPSTAEAGWWDDDG